MKFAKVLDAQSIPEWKRKYINYKRLKKLLKQISIAHQQSPLPELPSRSDSLDKGKRKDERFESLPLTVFPVQYRINAKLKLSDESIEPALSDRNYNIKTPEEKRFFLVVDQELEKITDFIAQREKEAIHQMQKFRPQLLILQKQLEKRAENKSKRKSPDRGTPNSLTVPDINPTKYFCRSKSDSKLPESMPNVPQFKRTMKSTKAAKARLRQALAEYYRGLELLKNYRILNYTGFVKILKKFDKTAGWSGTDFYLPKVDQSLSQSSKIIEQLIQQTEILYIDTFTPGKRQDGMRELRLPDTKARNHHGVTTRTGIFIGLAAPVLFNTIFTLADEEKRSSIEYLPIVLQIYAGFSVPIFFILLFGLNLYIWSYSAINYRFIFELDPRDHLSHHEFMEIAALFFCLWSYSVFFSISKFWDFIGIPSHYFPLLFVITALLIVFNPLPFYYSSSRRWFRRTLWRIVVSPIYPVEFRDFFLTDEFNSLVYSLASFQLFSCSYYYNFDNLDQNCNIGKSWFTPAISMLPAYWRFVQCLRRYYDTRLTYPHLLNAGKYLSTITVIWISATENITQSSSLLYLWVPLLIWTTGFTYSWDVYNDWGFLQRNSKHVLLRDQLMYNTKAWYYFAIVSNFFLRISWVFQVSIGVYSNTVDRRILLYGIALAEALRRFQWNFFRMENEHANNCGQFRVIKELPLPFEIISADLDADDRVSSKYSYGLRRQSLSSQMTRGEAYAILDAIGAEEGRFHADKEYETKTAIEQRRASSEVGAKFYQDEGEPGSSSHPTQDDNDSDDPIEDY